MDCVEKERWIESAICSGDYGRESCGGGHASAAALVDADDEQAYGAPCVDIATLDGAFGPPRAMGSPAI